MSPPLQVIALISGGKDSFFSLLHCLANDHTIVALANLHPPPTPLPPAPDADPQDLNSYMYQTVGHALVPLYATALGLPLYRQAIAGTAVDINREYSAPSHSTVSSSAPAGLTTGMQTQVAEPDPEDETESLIPLLRRIQAAHPHASALCAGAIQSTYQRTRIESVALRLGLVPLAYLWQYPTLPAPVPSPAGLLRDMATVGLDARIVKVATGGLDEEFLWENVCEEGVARRVERAVGRFGGSVLGEGGEYETLIVGGPRGVWRGGLVVGQDERVVRRGGGGECWIDFKEGKVEMRGQELMAEEEEEWRRGLRRPNLWDERFERILEELESRTVEEMAAEAQEADMGQLMDRECWMCTDGMSEEDITFLEEAARERVLADRWLDSKMCAEETRMSINRGYWRAMPLVVRSNSCLFISNLTSSSSAGEIEDQMARVVEDLRDILTANSISPEDIIFSTILLRSMSDFSKINHVYGQLFMTPNPPARATVGCGETLPPGVNVMLSVVVDLGLREERRGLHVQSRSYWAPANIGPYSQAISCRTDKDTTLSLVHIAGQIPLVPASMEVLQIEADDSRGMKTFEKQAVLSLQHLWRIGLEMQVTWWSAAVAFIVADSDAEERALRAWYCWKKIHEPPPPDARDDDMLSNESDAWDKRYGGLGSMASKDETARPLPDFNRMKFTTNRRGTSVPAFFAVQVEQLPRGCRIEWQSLGIAHQSLVRLKWAMLASFLRCRICQIDNTDLRFEHIEYPISYSIEHCVEQCCKFVARRSADSKKSTHFTLYTSAPASFCQVRAQIIPCKRLWGSHGAELIAGLVLQQRHMCEAA